MVHVLVEWPPETDTEIDVTPLESPSSGVADPDSSPPPEELE